jgi:hypothetical protein
MPINVEGYPTKAPMCLYYRDALECIEHLFGNPLFAGHIDYSPQRLWTTAEKLERIYTEWMTGDSAWEMQVSPRSFIIIISVNNSPFIRAIYLPEVLSLVRYSPPTKR